MLKKFFNLKLSTKSSKMLSFWEEDFNSSIEKHIDFLNKNIEDQNNYSSKFSKILEDMDVFSSNNEKNEEEESEKDSEKDNKSENSDDDQSDGQDKEDKQSDSQSSLDVSYDLSDEQLDEQIEGSDSLKESEESLLLEEWGLNRDKKIILMPGRLTRWKGQEVFIEAINLINKEIGHKSFYAVILGGDQGRNIYTKKIKRLAEQYRLTRQIKFIEHCKNMPLAYKISDLVVSPSIEPEAFGRVSVEAQSMQKPIIASDIGGSNETIVNNKTGFLFEAGNADSLSKTILTVLNLDKSLASIWVLTATAP